jgi:hypothetical protein
MEIGDNDIDAFRAVDGQHTVVRSCRKQLDPIPVKEAFFLFNDRHNFIGYQYFFHDYPFEKVSLLCFTERAIVLYYHTLVNDAKIFYSPGGKPLPLNEAFFPQCFSSPENAFLQSLSSITYRP